jgi:hypothetical protein
LGGPGPSKSSIRVEDKQKVSVIRFGSDLSEAVHDSMGVLGGRPLDRTVLCSIDEFYISGMEKNKKDFIIVDNIFQNGESGSNRLSPIKNFLVPMGDKDIIGVPYYANVLLLAYRSDLVDWNDLQSSTSWVDIWNKVKSIEGGNSSSNTKRVEWGFDFDMQAKETLSCAFVDAIVSGCRQITQTDNPLWNRKESKLSEEVFPSELQEWDRLRGEAVARMLGEDLKDPKIIESVSEQLIALQRLFSSSEKYNKRDHIWSRPFPNERWLNKDSAIYLCWYSQLRDLIHRNPNLATRLRVMSLPGGGFRGDWFLGIVKGSVSVTLGRKVIEILCSEREEYKRFIRGVGLPVTYRYYNKADEGIPDAMEAEGFLAWPSAQVTMNTVLSIHRKGLARSRINGYLQFRPALHTFGRMIAFAETANKASYDEKANRALIHHCVRRLPMMINVLTGKLDNVNSAKCPSLNVR